MFETTKTKFSKSFNADGSLFQLNEIAFLIAVIGDYIIILVAFKSKIKYHFDEPHQYNMANAEENKLLQFEVYNSYD